MNNKKEKGITLMSLVITIAVILIIAVPIAINTKTMINIESVQDLKNDISNLEQKVSDFYNEYGEIPASIEYTNINNLKDILNDKEKEANSKFYVIDLQAMKGISLNYGRDYEFVKNTNTETANKYNDLYIINEVTHNIFYVKGIITTEGDKTYYTDYLTPENVPVISNE